MLSMCCREGITALENGRKERNGRLPNPHRSTQKWNATDPKELTYVTHNDPVCVPVCYVPKPNT
jgi:hypothetical protein